MLSARGVKGGAAMAARLGRGLGNKTSVFVRFLKDEKLKTEVFREFLKETEGGRFRAFPNI